ncbi:tetratricopeptide repeat protein [Phormidium sp. CLA17]|uniref:tetratricopeptide repeat protein n=1 Tax=Leptolyngbya sp. Cla-17 TaxID=2803751 RepID=UPI00193421BC|nr:tetratricopeptide repeat protein [Leptolyngbya sp. Cla-17]MBM0744013.1 tetratricopeptide repeat protein [Leptolyngbya sp. Cla-17]
MINTKEILDPAKALFQQGVDQSRQGNRVEAIQAFDRALEQEPDHADVYGHRCVARWQLGDQQGAIADCQQAVIFYLEQRRGKQHQYALNMLQKLQK